MINYRSYIVKNIGLYTTTNHVNLIEIESEDNTSDKLNLKFPDIDQLIKAIPSNRLQENRRKLKTGFKLFQVYFMALSYIHIKILIGYQFIKNIILLYILYSLLMKIHSKLIQKMRKKKIRKSLIES